MKKILCCLLVLSLFCVGCVTAQPTATTTLIELSDDGITVDGKPASESADSAVYIAHDIAYYEDKESYESGNPYGEGTEDERHTQAQADAHTVVHITKAGDYHVTGTLSQGQIFIGLGEDAEDDETAVVNLILDNADITCSVAPAIVFRNVYECGDKDNAQAEVSTQKAGANLILAQNSVNHITGSHVAKIFEDNAEEEKLLKMDGAIYSYQSMNVDGSGELYLVADNEGLDTEMHLTINGGYLRIVSQNDGINTNEDGVSVTTINDGDIRILAGLGEEGDGIDSNGWIVINGGTLITAANPAADTGLDCDMGTQIFGGTVLALGSAMDGAEAAADQPVLNLRFAQGFDSSSPIVIENQSSEAVFAYDLACDQTLNQAQRNYTSAIFSSPDVKQGDELTIYTDAVIQGSHLDGLYESIISHANGTALSHGGAGSMMGMGGMRPDMGNMQMPEGEALEIPEGIQMPQEAIRPNGDIPEPSEGMEETERPQMPEGMQQGEPPEGFEQEQMPMEGETSSIFLIDSLNCIFNNVE